jgi:uncharacterized membrane protein YkoI
MQCIGMSTMADRGKPEETLMKKFVLAIVLALPMIAGAKDLACSIKAKRLDADTKAMVKVSESDARKTALGEVKAAGASVSSGGLEVEGGCLLYTYDIKIPGRSGAQEIVIDAGTGAVLNIEHESAAKEAAEKLLDKPKSKK